MNVWTCDGSGGLQRQAEATNNRCDLELSDDTKEHSSNERDAKVYTIPQYMMQLMLLSIPVINIIMLLVAIFDSKMEPNKRNLTIAKVILSILASLITMLLSKMAYGILISLLKKTFNI